MSALVAITESLAAAKQRLEAALQKHHPGAIGFEVGHALRHVESAQAAVADLALVAKVTCGYCDAVIEDAPDAFAEHDATCERNPLVMRVREVEAWKAAYLEWQETAAKLIESLQSQLAWTPVAQGLPTEPGCYEFLRDTDTVEIDALDIWRLDTELQSCTEWYWKDHDWFPSPLSARAYNWFRRIELPEAQ